MDGEIPVNHAVLGQFCHTRRAQLVERTANSAPDRGGRILRQVLQAPTAPPPQVVIPKLVSSDYAIHILLPKLYVNAELRHSKSVPHACESHTTPGIRSLLTVILKRI